MNTQAIEENPKRISFRTAALVSGFGLILMAVLAGWANFQVIQRIKGIADSAEAAALTASMASAIRTAGMAFLIVAFLDILVAWGLYELFRQDNPSLSLLTAWTRVAYAAVYLASILFLFAAARVAPGNPEAALEYFNVFSDGWMVGLFVFGVHLILLGWLSIESRNIHWIFGVLLAIAGIGYTIDSAAAFLVPEAGLEIALYTFVGEVVFMVWLMVRGLGRTRSAS